MKPVKRILTSMPILGILLAASCSADKESAQYVKSDDFPTQSEATVDTLEIPLIARVVQILPADSIIRIQTEGTPMWVYGLKSDDLSVADSIFPKGGGPGEYTHAAIAPLSDTDEYLIIDNGRQTWSRAGKDGVRESGPTGHFAVNGLRDVGFPRAGYVDMRPDGLCLRIRDMREGTETDSLVIPNINAGGESVNDTFVWDYDKDTQRIVLAFTDQNKLLTARLTVAGFSDMITYSGESLPNHIYYTDVKIDGDRLIALSQADVDLEAVEGSSAIEIYSFDGQPESRTNLPIIAQSMAIDRQAPRLIFISATDDNLYTCPLPTPQK